jgi:hypothetical protein
MNEISNRRSERIESVGSDSMAFGKLLDISTTGICFVHDKPAEKGSVMNVEVKNLKLKARVAYCSLRDKMYRIGMQFIETSPEIQKQIDSIVDAYSKGVPVNCRVL